MIRPRIIYTSLVATLTIFTALLVIRGAAASHFDSMFQTANANWSCSDWGSSPNGMNCRTDNSTFTAYSESSLSSAGKSTINSVLNSEFDPTDLSLTIESSGVYSGGSETDVILQYRTDLAAGLSGQAWCDDSVSSTKFDQHYAAFDTDSPSYALACHEIGHTVGLLHGPQSYPAQLDSNSDLGCMGTSGSSLGSHNADQINATY